jgi:hypothetical protein
MQSEINIGDEVFVAFVDGDSIDGRLIYKPQQPADFWILESNYNFYYINSSSGSIKYISKSK